MRAGTRVRTLAAAGVTAFALAMSAIAAPMALAVPPSTCNGLAITLQAVPIGAGGGVITAAMSPGADVIGGTMRADVIDGGPDDDVICGWDGADDIDGDLGVGEPGDDWISGGAENDVIDGNEGDDILWGNEDDDEMYGSSGDDSIRSGYGDDWINAGPEDDFVHCGNGVDVADGSTHNGGDVLSANNQCEVATGFNP